MKNTLTLTVIIVLLFGLFGLYEYGYLDFVIKPVANVTLNNDDIADQVNIQKQVNKVFDRYVGNYVNEQLDQIFTPLNVSASADASMSLGKYQLVKTNENENNKVIEFTKRYFNFLNTYRYTDQIPEIRKYHSKDMTIPDMIFADWWATRDVVVTKYNDVRVLNSSNGTYLIGANINIDVLISDDDTKANVQFLLKVNIVTENNELRILSVETVPAESVNEFVSSLKNENANPSNGSTQDEVKGSNVQKYVPTGGYGGNYTKAKELDNATIKAIVKENDERTVAISMKTTGGDVIGSGFFVRPGIIVTNAHVIHKGLSGQVRTVDGKAYEIDGVVTMDGVLDMAVLKLKEEVGTPVRIGDPRKLEKVDPVLAIGSPLGLYNTVTVGIFNNVWQETNGKITLQSSLPLAPGNSGGPLFNVDGEVVGVNTAIESGYADISFAGSIHHLSGIIGKLQSTSFDNIKSIKLNKINWKNN